MMSNQDRYEQPDQLPDQPPELSDATPAQAVELECVVTTPSGTPTVTLLRHIQVECGRHRTFINQLGN